MFWASGGWLIVDNYPPQLSLLSSKGALGNPFPFSSLERTPPNASFMPPAAETIIVNLGYLARGPTTQDVLTGILEDEDMLGGGYERSHLECSNSGWL